MVLKVTVCILLLSGIVYLAISHRSPFKVRLAALGALAVMIITVIICVFRIFMAPAVAQVPLYPDSPPPPPAPPPNTMALVLFIVILIAMFLVVLFISIREQRRVTSEDDGLSKLGL
jgi:cytochrome bd-type quinol oxidase subunit 2